MIEELSPVFIAEVPAWGLMPAWGLNYFADLVAE